MPDIEELLQRELRRVADQVQPAELRPLHAPSRPPRRGGARRVTTLRRWLLPSAAIGAVALCAALALLLTNVTGFRPTPQALAPTPVPRFYVSFDGYTGSSLGQGRTPVARFTVHDSADGRVTGTARISSSSSGFFWSVNAAADDRTFILSMVPSAPGEPGSHALIVYRLPVSASGAAGRVAKIGRFPIDAWVSGALGLSQDGTRLAVPLIYDANGSTTPPWKSGVAGVSTYAAIETVNLTTGATHTWKMQGYKGYWAGAPSWGSADTTVTFPWLKVTVGTRSGSAAYGGAHMLDLTLVGTGQLDTTWPPHRVPPGRLVWYHRPVPVASSEQTASLPYQWLTITNDGGSIVGASCGVTGTQSGTVTMKIVKMSAATGQLTDVLREQAVSYSGPVARAFELNKCAGGLWSVDASGQHLLVVAWHFGRIDNGVFTTLPTEIFLHYGPWTAW